MNVQPLFASSIFTISQELEVYQVINYDYRDPDGVYERLLNDENALQKEIDKIHSNMADFLAAEKVYINEKPIEQKIIHVDIGLRGTPEIVYFQWVVHFQGVKLNEVNSLESDVEVERAEYDIEVLYLFPQNTRILDVKTPMDYEIRGPLLFVWAQKGDVVGGHEAVKFQFH
ncbi:MAG: hypothetical protein ACFFDU_00235 [Candidatus Thorarchaeota archaeon]